MKFSLKDYQKIAVGEVLEKLKKARKRWREEGERSSFSLTAMTGAGKTVIAAAVVEALFHGDENFSFDKDPTAVVIWFSDDPSLNEQTRTRIQEASSRLTSNDLVVVQNTFNQEMLDAGKVYFLNTHKLSRNSLLVRGSESAEDDPVRGRLLPEMRPDLRSYTIWDTIQNTIDDPSRTLYLVLDEAHRGFGRVPAAAQEEEATIVRRLINGTGLVSGIPIVWGISATIERFSAAMGVAVGRTSLPGIKVDSSLVQDSGLLKDTIILDVPLVSGPFDTVLVRRATSKIKESSHAWADYAMRQGDANTVKPLMVLQVPNVPDHREIGRALDTVFQEWPELTRSAVAHVFGEHTSQTFGNYSVPYISPEHVQEATDIRLLIAKDAISTGWDCPRAEVLVSFRPASDRTHITQLVGRMVRTPLARRIPGNDRLNSVNCLLPFFDPQTVEAVARDLMNGGEEGCDSGLPGRRVLINPQEMTQNPDVPEAVWQKLATLQSQTLPQKGAKPVKRLTAFAHELATDDLLVDAGKLAHKEMHKVLDAFQVRYIEEIADKRKEVLVVPGRSLIANISEGTKTFEDFVEEADHTVIEDAFKRTARIISPDLARTYAEHLASKIENGETETEALDLAHIAIAAIGLVPFLQSYIDLEAESLVKNWLDQYRVKIRSLASDERRDAYAAIQSMTTDPGEIDLAVPSTRMESTSVCEADGVERPLPTFRHHLLCDAEGNFPVVFDSSWESGVLETEMQRSGFRAWYRNPPRNSQDSLGVAYIKNGQVKLMHPDYIFFAENSDGIIVADIVDPHGTHLSDAIPKLQGLARYAEAYGKDFRRIDAVAMVGSQLRVLDMLQPAVRQAVAEAQDAEALYQGDQAVDFR